MRVLVLNSGSSSIKFRLVDVADGPSGALTPQPALLHGVVKGISEDDAGLEACVVAADEETWIARETIRCVRRAQS